MLQSISSSISRKFMAVVLVTTFLALLVASVAMMAYEIQSYRKNWIADATTQADILARVSTPALQFNDPATATGNLAVLRTRPQVREAALYTAPGVVFARYVAPGHTSTIPPNPGEPSYRVDGNQVVVVHRIMENNELVGIIYLRTESQLTERIMGYLLILIAVMVVSLMVAAMVSSWLQAAVIRPILAVTGVARDVMERRNFALRVKKTTNDEVGVLVDAFNGMLNEVGGRAEALEASNRSLTHEMHERREAEEALRIADRRKDEFLATLAHELRNPLAPLMSGLEIMNVTGPDSPASTKSREIMERQLRQMVRLVDDLLDVSRISTGKLAIRTGRVELQAIIQNAVETVSSLFRNSGHTFDLSLPETPIILHADATRLSQVFSNLLNNSCKYTDAGGRISLRVELAGGEAIVTVSDNGIGLSAEMLENIFGMFTQVDRSLERSQAGLGVGLTLAKRLVELHGGSIEARSAGLGKGSSMIVRLPVAEVGGSAGKAQQEASPGAAAHTYRILLADDNIDFAASMAELLRTLGHEVCVTHDGKAALAAVENFTPQFCFLDIGLPFLNGYDLARALRAHPASRDAVMIAVTGWGQERDRQLATEAGFDHHMVKPVNLARISAIIEAGPERRNG